MKKLLSLLLVLVFALGAIASCGPKENEALINAGDYINALYKDESTNTTVDYDVVANVVYDGVTYPITWTVDVTEGVTIVDSVNAGFKTVKVVRGDADIPYKLTASITDGTDTVTKTFDRVVPAKVSQAAIVEAAYQLAAGAVMDGVQTLTGKIIRIDTPYDADYKNVTVTIVVENLTDKPIMCYRLKGDNAADLKIGDTITVEGTIKNYNGTIEFDAGCQIKAYTAWAPTAAEKITATEAELDKSVYTTLNYNQEVTLPATGATYTDVTIAWTATGATVVDNKFSVTLGAEAQTVVLTATLTCGEATNTKTINVTVSKTKTDAEIATEAKALAEGASLPGRYMLTGVITKIDTVYSEQYGNITVTIAPTGADDKTIQCYRLKGDAAANLKVGDTITVEGVIKNYKGTVQFDSGCTIKNYTAWAPSAAEKVATEKAALAITNEVNVNGTVITLPATGVTYTDVVITWAATGATIDNGKVTVTLGDEASSFTLTATLTCGETTDTKAFTVAVAAKPAVAPVKVAVPQIGSSYKFAMYQATLGKLLYITGDTDAEKSYQLVTSDGMKNGIDVTLEAVDGVEGAFRIYFMKADAKTYIEVYYDTEDEKGRLRLVTDVPATYYTLDATTGVAVSEANGTKYYVGSYNNYDKGAVSEFSYISGNNASKIDVSQFPLFFYELKELATIPAADKVADEKKFLNINAPANVAFTTVINLVTSPIVYEDVTIAWTATGATIVDNTVTIVPTTTAQTVTLTATITCGSASVTKEYTLNVPALLNIQENVAYKIGAGDIYWNGKVSSGKLQKGDAANVYIEKSETAGKYYIYVLQADGTTKDYLSMTSDSTTKFKLSSTKYAWAITADYIQSAEELSARCIYCYNSNDFRTYAIDYSSSSAVKASWIME